MVLPALLGVAALFVLLRYRTGVILYFGCGVLGLVEQLMTDRVFAAYKKSLRRCSIRAFPCNFERCVH